MGTEDFENVFFETTGGIPYKLVEGYPKFNESTDAVSGEEEYVIRASDLDGFLEECFPRKSACIATPSQSGDPNSTTYSEPQIYLPRTMPGRDILTTVKVDVEPLDKSRPADPYSVDTIGELPAQTFGPLLKLHIFYELISRDFFREISRTSGAEYLQIPPTNLFSTASTDANGNPLPPGIGEEISGAIAAYQTEPSKDKTLAAYKVVPTSEWTYRLQPYAHVDWNKISGCIGKLNDRRLIVPGGGGFSGAYPETVMFSGFSATRQHSMYRIVFDDAWALELKFSERTINDDGGVYGWNHVYSSKTNAGRGGWTRLERAPQGSKRYLYESTDLAARLLTATINE